MLLHELESLDKSEGLVYTPAHWQVVDGHLPGDEENERYEGRGMADMRDEGYLG